MLGFYTTRIAAGLRADAVAIVLPVAGIVLVLRERRTERWWLEYIVEYRRAAMAADGATPDAIAQTQARQRASGTDSAQPTGALIGTTVISLVIGALAGAFMRTRIPRAAA